MGSHVAAVCTVVNDALEVAVCLMATRIHARRLARSRTAAGGQMSDGGNHCVKNLVFVVHNVSTMHVV